MIAPPGRAERLMRWSLAPWERAAVLGDMNEEFNHLLNLDGAEAARRWYWRQAIQSVWPNVVRRARGDESRLRLLQGQLFWVPYIALRYLRFLEGEIDLWIPILLVLGTIVVVGQALFKKRLRPNRLQRRVNLGIIFLLPLLGWVVIQRGSWQAQQMFLGALGMLIVLQVWPWWGPHDVVPQEVAVRKKPEFGESAAHLLTVTVPNRLGAMSGIILCKPGVSRPSVPTALHTWDPTIVRTFKSTDSIRICAMVNTNDAAVVAKVELLDRLGSIATAVREVASHVAIEPVVPKWDDYAEVDPPSVLSQIDVTIPLAGISPGRYTIRVSTPQAAMSSSETDAITIVA